MQLLGSAIREALLTGESRSKVMLARKVARDWRLGRLQWDLTAPMPDHPACPADLQILPPTRMPRRRKSGSLQTQIALWHSLAHIEFVAIDLALDMAGRFGEAMGREFVSDFVAIAADEAMHFALIDRKLRSLGSFYGALPAHGGLWQAASDTRHDVAARLAVVPMVLEARGLDVTPAMIERVRGQGDTSGARILQRILDDEIRHVAAGARYFAVFCAGRGESPAAYWKALVKSYFRGVLKPPFNDSARLSAGLSRDFYACID